MPTDRKMDGVNLLDYIPDVSGAASAKQGQPPHEKLFWKAGNSHIVLADGWKFHRDLRAGKSWLFDMKNDPTEQNNLAADKPDRVRAMEAMLDAHNAEQKPPAWPILLETVIRVDKTYNTTVEADDQYVFYSN